MNSPSWAGRVDPALVASDPPRYLRALVIEWDTEDARLVISLMARDGLVHGPARQDALSAMRTAARQAILDHVETFIRTVLR